MNRYLFGYFDSSQGGTEVGVRSFNINFGPQHPASHGVLRIILQLRGEIIERADTHIGLLHRGTEKLIEERPYVLGLPYFDRLDYTAILMQEHAYCLTIEELMGTTNYLSNFARIRTLFDELTRLLNHLIALSTHAMDVGTMAVFFWAFEERERIMEFYERVSGARMHAAFYRPNEMSIAYVSGSLLRDITLFCRDLLRRIGQIEGKLAATSIWRARLVSIGVITPCQVATWAISGPLARSAGVRSDLRLSRGEVYGNYAYLQLRSFMGEHGDCYDRFLIRMREMVESVHLILQISREWGNSTQRATWGLQLGGRTSTQGGSGQSWYIGMEELISHFKNFSEGALVARGLSYRAVESAKGEFGTLVVADNTARPFRCRIRSPAYYHTQLFGPMSQGHYFADLITIIGSQDIVMGEVDR